MTKKKFIRSASELPDWFDLSKYQPVSNLSAYGWYQQLNLRSDLWLCDLDVGEIHTYGEDIEKSRKEFKEELKQGIMVERHRIRENPIIDFRNTFHRHSDMAVHLMTVREVHSATHDPVDLEEDERFKNAKELMAHVFKENAVDFDFLRRQYESHYGGEHPAPWLDEPINNNIGYEDDFFVNIQVDLAVPEEILIQQFRKLIRDSLSSVKRNDSYFANSKAQNYTSWVRYGVLPYIDLKMWEEEIEEEITDRVMAFALFPQGNGDSDTVRKTVAPLAEKLLSRNFLKTLHAIAISEELERNSE